MSEVPVEFPETKQFIEEHLEQQCLKNNKQVWDQWEILPLLDVRH